MRDADRPTGRGLLGSRELEFRVSSKRSNGSCVVHVAGEIDLYAAPRLENELEDAIRSGATHVLVDLSDVPFIDSSGLAVLLGAAHKIGRENFSLTGVQPQIARVLLTTGASWLLKVTDGGEGGGELA
jgi:anti-sigma B factor antagonist